MVDGTAVLTTFMHGMMAMGGWQDERGVNILDTGAHYYEVYTCADGKFLSVGAIEPQFYAELLEKTGLADDPEFLQQNDKALWPKLKLRLAEVIATRTRDEWAEIFDGSDACVAPILSLGEAPAHPHNVARSTFVERDGIVQPAPAPRFSRTEADISRSPAHAGQHTDEVLGEWGVADADRCAALRGSGAIA
jgi:alpha-methylacyl-CoA racemase